MGVTNTTSIPKDNNPTFVFGGIVFIIFMIIVFFAGMAYQKNIPSPDMTSPIATPSATVVPLPTELPSITPLPTL